MLHKEQNYVKEIAEQLGIEFEIKHHEISTISCQEKLNILPPDWELERIVKALYFQRNGEQHIGVVTPEIGENIKRKEVLSKISDVSKKKAERYWVNPERIPTGMVMGTCTPFPLASTMGTEISNILIKDYSKINDSLVDISIGGIGEEALKLSMHLRYQDIYRILKHRFGDGMIHKY